MKKIVSNICNNSKKGRKNNKNNRKRKDIKSEVVGKKRKKDD